MYVRSHLKRNSAPRGSVICGGQLPEDGSHNSVPGGNEKSFDGLKYRLKGGK